MIEHAVEAQRVACVCGHSYEEHGGHLLVLGDESRCNFAPPLGSFRFGECNCRDYEPEGAK